MIGVSRRQFPLQTRHYKCACSSQTASGCQGAARINSIFQRHFGTSVRCKKTQKMVVLVPSLVCSVHAGRGVRRTGGADRHDGGRTV